MTGRERQDLDTAITLIGDLRTEMLAQFSRQNESLTAMKEAQAAHLAVHDERDRNRADSGVTRRWVVQTVVAVVGIVVAAGAAILGLVGRLI